VDAGAATCSLAGNLGLAPSTSADPRATHPLHEPGGAAQTRRDPPQIRAAFALTEPIPFVGVETGMLAGKVRVAEWPDGGEPLLQVEKRAASSRIWDSRMS